ncbi:MAG: PAS domain-containing protein [Proteobacteria bacterium]|nr:PAS domain-containing protein [Pseudomonadota bacterium]MBU1905133.1 PAS domain-containing protein [Pseudomonadota bacterium]
MTYISPVIESILGYHPSEIIGKNYAEFIYQEDRDRVLERFEKLRLEILGPDEYRILSKSGEICWIRRWGGGRATLTI